MTKAASERTTYNDDGTLDEIVVAGGAHLEHMDKNRWFLLMTRRNGSQIAVWFKGDITVTEERPND